MTAAVHRRYHALLEVSNVLNSQREMDSLYSRSGDMGTGRVLLSGRSRNIQHTLSVQLSIRTSEAVASDAQPVRWNRCFCRFPREAQGDADA
jgi:hypothetical protein